MILLDIIMPDMDGYEVCQLLKNDETTSHIPVIFLTSLNSIEDQEKGIKVGAIDFISKPFSKNVILQRIQTHLKIRKLENQILSTNCTKDNDMKNTQDTILVVDDAPQNIALIVEILKKDYKVSVATSGEKALKTLDNGLIPDIILLDIIMPVMDGYEICKELKSINKYKDIPIIFLTILEDKEDVIKGLELGAVDYVSKPVEPSILKARIQTHLKLKHFQDKLINDIKLKDEILIKQSKLAALGEMFENITHQWKQPLATVSISSGTIRMQKDFGTLQDEDLYRSLESIETSIKHLGQTIDDFRDFLKEDVKKQHFNIKSTVTKTLKLLDSKFKNLNINIENNVDDIEIFTLKNDLIQILMNILSNADEILKNKDGDKNIKIATVVKDNILILKVNDNGGGIKNEVMDNIFDKYITTKKDGSGIGLYMSKKLIEERLGGDIKSYNENGGACFEISFPIK